MKGTGLNTLLYSISALALYDTLWTHYVNYKKMGTGTATWQFYADSQQSEILEVYIKQLFKLNM